MIENEEKAKTGTNIEKIEVIYGPDNIKKRTIDDFHLIQDRLDNCTDFTGPYVIDTPLWNEFIELKKRGIKLRLITEITKDNISYSKKLVNVFEIRHLDGVKGNFGIADGREYGGGARIIKGGPPIEFIRSNVKTFVEQQQFFFDMLWNKAISVEQKIKEIEEGIEPVKTKVLENPSDIYNHLMNTIKKSTEWYICSSTGGMQMAYNNFFNLYKDIVERQKKGKGNGIRWLTHIDDNKNSIEIVKTFLNAGVKVRHIKNLPSMDFSFNSNSIQATIERMDYSRFMNNLLVSNEPAYVKHFTSYFQELWNNQGIDAVERIKDIEEGMEYDIEVIRHSDRALKIYLYIVNSAQIEILFIFPTPKAFIRQIKAIDLATQASKEKKVKVKILTPKNEEVKDLIEHLLKEVKETSQDTKHSIVSSSSIDMEVRYIEKMSYTKSSILVVDRKESLVMELKDDSKHTFMEAIGLSTHSTSKASVLSYVAIFENLWKQSELYQEIKESNEKLEVKDKVLNEFIHIAAHELRNPIQPILSLSQFIKSILEQKAESEIDKDKIFSFLDVIIRNAKKLLRLSDDVLDIAKIETNSLILNKEKFNLKELLEVLINDFKIQQKMNSCEIKLRFNLEEQLQDESLFLIEADRVRISQVASNLLLNALKFTNNDCSIQVIFEKKESNGSRKEVVVSIKDTGTGIDPEIYPRLFTKFASKSSQGTGLGLYICKNIIEAHGGKIWAENNKDGQGATFAFSLPIIN